MATSRAKPKMQVRYTGLSHERRITEENWKELGIDNPTVSWLRDAPHNVQPIERLSGLDENQMDMYIIRDGDFVIEPVPEPEPEAAEA